MTAPQNPTRYPNGIQVNDGNLMLGSTYVTATAAEINAISGGGLSAAELGVLDGVTPGTAAASKAVVLDANSKVVGVRQFTEVVAATNVIAAAESGSVFFLNAATEFVSTLPAPASGLHFTFIVTAAPSGADYTITTTTSANIILGQVYTVDVNSATDPDFEATGGDTISFVSAKSIAGDRVEVFCDGTNWFAYCFCSVFDAITITTAS